jgi:hypothetical protein
MYSDNLQRFESKERISKFCALQEFKNDLDSLLLKMEPIGCSETSSCS